jgi:hypothetical protein
MVRATLCGSLAALAVAALSAPAQDRGFINFHFGLPARLMSMPRPPGPVTIAALRRVARAAWHDVSDALRRD